MKKVKFLSTLAVIAFTAMTASVFVSCSDDDDDNTSKNEESEPEPSVENDGVTVASDALVAYFPLNSASEVCTVGTGVTYTGLTGSASFASGRRGNAYQGADNSYASFTLASNNSITSFKEFTVSMWIKSTYVDGYSSMILSIDGGDPTMGSLGFMIEGSNSDADGLFMKIYFYNTTSEWGGFDCGIYDAAFTTDKWFHFVATYDASTSYKSLYSNGKLITYTETWAGPEDENGNQEYLGDLTLDPSSSHLYIGGWANYILGVMSESWAGFFPGMVDEIRIYNRCLTASEVAELYAQEVDVID